MEKQFLKIEISKQTLNSLIQNGSLVAEDIRALNRPSKDYVRNTMLAALCHQPSH